MPETVGQFQQGAYTSPATGESLDASVVLGNDNNTRTKFNSHDSDTGIHLQSSVLASRPAAGTAGRKWLTTDGLRVYYDTGAAWSEIAYLPSVGGTVTGGVTISSGGLTISAGGLTVTGAIAFNSALTATTGTFSGVLAPNGGITGGTVTELDINSPSGSATKLRFQRSGGTGGVVIYAGGTTTENFNLTDAGALTLRAGLTATTGTFSGAVSSSSASGGIGYATGAGGTVTQLTAKTEPVTINKTCGQITMAAGALAGGSEVAFTVNNSSVAATDIIVVNRVSGGSAQTYGVSVDAVAAGSFSVLVTNLTGASLNEQPVIGFAVIKGVTS